MFCSRTASYSFTKEPWRCLSPSSACSMGVRVLHCKAASPDGTPCSLQLSHQQLHRDSLDAAL